MRTRAAIAATIGATILVATAGTPVLAQDVTVTVPGTSNPWLAGMPVGTMLAGDVVPDEAPVAVPLTGALAGGSLSFDASGTVGHPNVPAGPDGATCCVYTHAGGEANGISDVRTPANSLLGVFLGPGLPTMAPAPATLDFSTEMLRDFATLSPGLQQVFFIGDGRTSGGLVQRVLAPSGATTLHLGTMDQFGWYNNTGAFEVGIYGDGGPVVTVTPEPATLLLLAGGLLPLGAGLLRRRRG